MTEMKQTSNLFYVHDFLFERVFILIKIYIEQFD